MDELYGKFLATVLEVEDPEKRGSIVVDCEDAFGESPSGWCDPSYPYTSELGGDFYVPEIGAKVWIEFSDVDDADSAIWSCSGYDPNGSPQADYTKVTEERIIGFKGTKIIMREDEVEIQVGKSSLLFNEKGFSVNPQGIEVPVIVEPEGV